MPDLTAETVTDEQIDALRAEAERDRDAPLARDCTIALGASRRRRGRSAINKARARIAVAINARNAAVRK